MTFFRRRYTPTDTPMNSIEGLRFYADSLRRCVGISGDDEGRALDSHLDRAETAQGTTEADVVAKVEELLGVIVTKFGPANSATVHSPGT